MTAIYERFNSFSSFSAVESPDFRISQFSDAAATAAGVVSSSLNKPSNSTFIKLKRAFLAAAKIGRGLAALEKKGFTGKILHEFYWMEALTDSHYFGLDIRKYFLMWKNSDTVLSFRRWFREARALKLPEVTYLSPEKRKTFQLSFKNGRLFTQDGSPFCTSKSSSLFSGQGSALFVIGADGLLYAGEQIITKIHHSSMCAGEAVLGAGIIETDINGSILKISDESGHYRPNERNVFETLLYFQNNGVDLDTVRFVIGVKSPEDVKLEGCASHYLKHLSNSNSKSS